MSSGGNGNVSLSASASSAAASEPPEGEEADAEPVGGELAPALSSLIVHEAVTPTTTAATAAADARRNRTVSQLLRNGRDADMRFLSTVRATRYRCDRATAQPCPWGILRTNDRRRTEDFEISCGRRGETAVLVDPEGDIMNTAAVVITLIVLRERRDRATAERLDGADPGAGLRAHAEAERQAAGSSGEAGGMSWSAGGKNSA
jgi:hypothetical protein